MRQSEVPTLSVPGIQAPSLFPSGQQQQISQREQRNASRNRIRDTNVKNHQSPTEIYGDREFVSVTQVTGSDAVTSAAETEGSASFDPLAIETKPIIDCQTALSGSSVLQEKSQVTSSSSCSDPDGALKDTNFF